MQIDYVSTLIHKLLWNHVICIAIKESMVRPLFQHYEHECIWSKWVSSNEVRVNLGGAVGCCAGGGVRRLLGWGREGIQCQQERPPLQCNQQFANIRGCHPPQLAALPHQNQHSCHRVFINSGKPPTRQKLLKKQWMSSILEGGVKSGWGTGGPQPGRSEEKQVVGTNLVLWEGEDHPPIHHSSANNIWEKSGLVWIGATGKGGQIARTVKKSKTARLQTTIQRMTAVHLRRNMDFNK